MENNENYHKYPQDFRCPYKNDVKRLADIQFKTEKEDTFWVCSQDGNVIETVYLNDATVISCDPTNDPEINTVCVNGSVVRTIYNNGVAIEVLDFNVARDVKEAHVISCIDLAFTKEDDIFVGMKGGVSFHPVSF